MAWHVLVSWGEVLEPSQPQVLPQAKLAGAIGKEGINPEIPESRNPVGWFLGLRFQHSFPASLALARKVPQVFLLHLPLS